MGIGHYRHFCVQTHGDSIPKPQPNHTKISHFSHFLVTFQNCCNNYNCHQNLIKNSEKLGIDPIDIFVPGQNFMPSGLTGITFYAMSHTFGPPGVEFCQKNLKKIGEVVKRWGINFDFVPNFYVHPFDLGSVTFYLTRSPGQTGELRNLGQSP